MSISLTVNDRAVTADVEPRTNLADFLRDGLLLTGTHVGCEHGVCGACTLLIDGKPARSCITFAASCAGHKVCSIEGLETDTVMTALRAAFTAEHALQCGYCTPGMLVTARDIVLNLPDADDDRVRLELSGNLCRCTGYNGIVRAIRRVLDQRLDVARPVPAPLPKISLGDVEEMALPSAAASSAVQAEVATGGDGRSVLKQRLRVSADAASVWTALCDPRLVAGCVPGAVLDAVQDGRISGHITVALGPIKGQFGGAGAIAYDAASRRGAMTGEGRDRITGTSLSAEAVFAVSEAGPQASILEVTVTYALRGPLAQFGRGPIVQVFAAEIAGQVGRNLEARLKGEEPPAAPPKLNAIALAAAVFKIWLKGLVERKRL